MPRNERPRPVPALSHVGPDGAPRMVDVGTKAITSREAVARGRITLSSATWIMWTRVEPKKPSATVSASDERLLTDDAVAEIDRAEAQYVRAIDELTKLARPKLEKADSPLIVNLRERLMTIDAAIDEYRMEIDRNRFNAHLRQQLLWIYQEKRRTLEQVQESNGHAS